MKEEFITFEQAKALKECGFDWECDHFYESDNYLKESTIFSQTFRVSDYRHNFNRYDPNRHGQICNPYYSAPTQALAQKWLRDVKGVDIIVTLFRDIDARVEPYEISRLYEVEICVGESDLCAGKYFPDYESALSAGIDAALELIKQK